MINLIDLVDEFMNSKKRDFERLASDPMPLMGDDWVEMTSILDKFKG